MTATPQAVKMTHYRTNLLVIYIIAYVYKTKQKQNIVDLEAYGL